MKGGVAGKINKKNMQDRDDNFTVRESGGTVRSLSGLRSGQVSEILSWIKIVGTYEDIDQAFPTVLF
jgi:hypothetical protein